MRFIIAPSEDKDSESAAVKGKERTVFLDLSFKNIPSLHCYSISLNKAHLEPEHRQMTRR